MIRRNRACVDAAVHDVFAVVAASSHLQTPIVGVRLRVHFLQDLGLEKPPKNRLNPIKPKHRSQSS